MTVPARPHRMVDDCHAFCTSHRHSLSQDRTPSIKQARASKRVHGCDPGLPGSLAYFILQPDLNAATEQRVPWNPQDEIRGCFSTR